MYRYGKLTMAGVSLSWSDSDVLPVTDDVAAKEGRQLNDGLIVLHRLPLLDCKAHYLSRLGRLRHASASDVVHSLCSSHVL